MVHNGNYENYWSYDIKLRTGGEDLEEKEIWERIAFVESSAKSAHHRLDRIEHIADSIHLLASEMHEMRNDFTNVLERVRSIEERPVKRYDVIINSIITALAGGISGFLLSLIL